MPPARRTDLLRVVEKLDLPVIEDNVYGFLDSEPPLPRSRRSPASLSTASPRRSLPVWRLASSCRRSGCVKAWDVGAFRGMDCFRICIGRG